MATYYPSTSRPEQFNDPATQELLSGGSIEAYLAGTSTPTNMYTDAAGTSAGAVITLNAGGFPEVSGNIVIIWQQAGIDYKFILKDASGTVIATTDNISSLANDFLSNSVFAVCQTVSDMANAAGPIITSGVVLGPVSVADAADTGALIQTSWYSSATKDGGGKYEVITNAERILRGLTADSYTCIALLGGTAYYAALVIDDDVLASQFGFPSTTGTDAATASNAALAEGKRATGAIVKLPPNTVDLESTIYVPTGCHLLGEGVVESFTVNKRSTSFDFDPGTSTTLVAVQLGENGDPASRNRGIRASNIRVQSTDASYGIAFSTVDTDDAANFRETVNWSIEWCTSFGVLIGFRHRNAWTAELIHNHAIQCGTGFLIDGAGAGGGTSTKYLSNIAYQCDIGWHLESGWNYSGMDSCGADGCRIGLLFEMSSGRGSSIRNFGIERIDDSSGQGYGIYIDDGGSGTGYFTLDGLNYGVHDSANITFIHVEDAGQVIIRGDLVVTSAILNSCIFYTQNTTTADVVFYDLRLFTSSTASIGDLFSPNVTLINCEINNRRYHHATGGFDEVAHSVTYTSGGGDTGQATPNKPVYSREIFINTNSAGSNRFITSNGTDPAYNTTPLPDWCYIKFTNATDTGTPAQIGFRSEDHTANTGIIRDPALSGGTTITLTGPGDWVVFQKRPDGNLYQVEMVNPPI